MKRIFFFFYPCPSPSSLLISFPLCVSNLFHSNFGDELIENRVVNSAKLGSRPRERIDDFLNVVPGVTFHPLPLDLMLRRSFIKARPPIEICFFTKTPAHCFDDVARIGQNPNLARLAQLFQTNPRRRNFRRA